MKAMIFAAGLGTRLKPITDQIPKALVEVGGKTLLEIAIEKLMDHGFNEIVINVHHFADQIISFLNQKKHSGVRIQISDERDNLLDTGGGLKKAASLLAGNEPVLIYNVDILTNLNLTDVLVAHKKSNPLATLVVRKRKSDRILLFDSDMNLSGWKNNKTGEIKIARSEVFGQSKSYAFSGIQIINPELLTMLGSEEKFSIIDCYLTLASEFDIKGFVDASFLWLDVGKPEQLAEARKLRILNA